MGWVGWWTVGLGLALALSDWGVSALWSTVFNDVHACPLSLPFPTFPPPIPRCSNPP